MGFSRNLFARILILMSVLCVQNATAGAVVVVSARSAIMSLSTDQVAQIFLGKTSTFPDGTTALPVDLLEGSPVRDDFYKRMTGKSPSLLKAYWARMIFTGKAYPPKEMPNQAAARKLIANNPHYIGYLESSAVDDSVRIVTLVIPGE